MLLVTKGSNVDPRYKMSLQCKGFNKTNVVLQNVLPSIIRLLL